MAKSESEPNFEHIDEVLDDIIRNFMTEANPDGQHDDPLTAAMADGALASLSRLTGRSSAIEKVLLVEIVAGRIADALAPALARALAPEILSVLTREQPAPAAAKEPGTKETASRKR